MERVLILASMLIAVAGSGCVEPGEPSSTTFASSPSPSSTTESTTNAATSSAPPPTSSSAAAPNEPPTATLNGSVSNGSAPLEVVFTIEGEDPEGAALTWALDFDFDDIADESGDELPANVTHVFELPGEYVATLTVSDGELEGTASFDVSVIEAVETDPEPVVFEGSAFIPDPVMVTEGECLFPLLALAGLPTGGISGDVHDVPGEIIGWNYVLSSAGFVTIWVNAALEYVGEGVSGTVPEGAVDVLVCSEAAVDADYVLTITHPDYVPPA